MTEKQIQQTLLKTWNLTGHDQLISWLSGPNTWPSPGHKHTLSTEQFCVVFEIKNSLHEQLEFSFCVHFGCCNNNAMQAR